MGAAAVTIPYLLPLILGRTFNLTSYKAGVDIFPTHNLQNTPVIDNHNTHVTFSQIETLSDKRDMLHAGGSIGLKVKAVSASASGEYLKDRAKKTSDVEFAAYIRYETVTETMDFAKEPRLDWHLLSPRYLGTHFVRSITHGGELIVSIKLTTTSTRDRDRIKGALAASFPVYGPFNADIEAGFEKFSDISKENTHLKIKYYGNILPTDLPADLPGVLRLIKQFPSRVNDVNGGKGIPLTAELLPLSVLKHGVHELRTQMLDDYLIEIENRLSDLDRAKHVLIDRVSEIEDAQEQDENQAGELYQKLSNKLDAISQVLAAIDLTTPTSVRQFQPALDAYREDGRPVVQGHWTRKANHLIDRLANTEIVSSGGAVFIQWGSSRCSGDTYQLYSGTMAGSSSAHSGNGYNYVCLPDDPQFNNPRPGFQSASVINSIQYPNSGPKFLQPFSCSVCKARNNTLMIPARRDCPRGWSTIYRGVLQAQRYNQHRSEYVCMDVDMEVRAGQGRTPGQTLGGTSHTVEAVCNTLKCPPYSQGAEITCVLCQKTPQ